VAPPSVHARGSVYDWRCGVNGKLPTVPSGVLAAMREKPKASAAAPGEPIGEGGRNAALASLAGVIRRKGMSPAAIEAALLEENRTRCQPPLPDAEVRQIAASVGRYQPGPASATPPPVDLDDLGAVTAAELCEDDGEEVASIVPGFLVAGSITEIDAAVKAGKTTLELAAAKAITTGGEFLGRQCPQGPVVLLSEESRPTLREALRRAKLTDSVDLYVVCGIATRRRPWPELVAGAIALAEQKGAVAIMVDTLSTLAGLGAEEENDAGAAMAAILPLRVAADGGLGVWISRHDRKSGGPLGESGRGSSAFAGAVDSIFTLRRAEDAMSPNVRRLQGVSRFDDCVGELDIEWTDDGYVSRGDPTAHAAQSQDAALLAALPVGIADAATARKLAEAVPKLSQRRAKEKLEELAQLNRIGRIGSGKRGDPHLYYAFFSPEPEKGANFPADSGDEAPTPPDSSSEFHANGISQETQESQSENHPQSFMRRGFPLKGETPRPQETSLVGVQAGDDDDPRLAGASSAWPDGAPYRLGGKPLVTRRRLAEEAQP
jgi:hypothetical protein